MVQMNNLGKLSMMKTLLIQAILLMEVILFFETAMMRLDFSLKMVQAFDVAMIMIIIATI